MSAVISRIFRRALAVSARAMSGRAKREAETGTSYDPWPWLRSSFDFRTLLDIGANDGAFGAFIAGFLKTERAYFFEPQPSCLPEIRRLTRDLPHAEILPLALSDRSARVMFHQTNQNASSSLLHLGAPHLAAFPEIREARTFEVEARTLDEVMEGRELPREILIKMDVQGVEDRVIRGGAEVFRRARAVLVEMSFVQLYEGQALFEEVHESLAACGLRFSGMRNQIVSTRPLFGHCIYVRPD